MTTENRGVLYVIGTPIGNLEDITLRALKVLQSVALIAAEDTRITARLLGRHNINTKCVSFREQNSARAIPKLIARLEAGESIALVSDAGTPSISDPGEQLVSEVASKGIIISPIPGPSALAAAMSTAALPGEGVRFIGFLPRSGKNRIERLRAMALDPSCTIIYESPRRLPATLVDLTLECGANRKAVVFRELTKMHEEIVRGTLSELSEHFNQDVRGEITVAIAGCENIATEDLSGDKLEQLVADQIASGRSAKDTANTLATALGLPKKQIYSLAVEIIGKNRIS